MMETPTAAAEQPQQISDFGRVIGVLTSPSKTFADIVRKPTWVLPIALLAVFGITFSFVMNQRVDWYKFMQRQIENSPRADRIPPEQRPQIIAQQAKFAPAFAYCIGALGNLIFALWLGLIYWGGFNVLGGAGTNFKTSLGIAAHSLVPGLVVSPFGILVMFLKERGDVDPEHLLASSVGSFLPEDSPKWLTALGNSFEIFWLWILFLLAVGFAATNPKKISLGKALGIVIGIWLIGVFVKVSAAALFS